MIPNGHESTYFFFNSIIKLGLFRPELGFIRKINLFLYYWETDVKADENKKGKGTRSRFPNISKKNKTHKRRYGNKNNTKSSV